VKLRKAGRPAVEIDITEAIDLYKNGLSLKEVGKNLGVSESTIRKELLKNSVKMRSRGNRGKNKIDIDDLILVEMYLDGMSLRQIAEIHGVCHQTVSNRLKKFDKV
jgi:transposase